jgi:hypothetical protein
MLKLLNRCRSLQLKFFFLLGFMLLCLQATPQEVYCDFENSNLKSGTNQESPLLYLPIQQSLLITDDREEQITLKVRPGAGIDKIVGSLTYYIGNEERQRIQEVFSFSQISQGTEFNTWVSDPFQLIYEEWIDTYYSTGARLRLAYEEKGETKLEESYGLGYISINPTFLNSLSKPGFTYLLEDSTIVHLGNSLYIQLEEIRKKRLDANSHFSDDSYGRPLEIRPILDSIWQEEFFADYYSREKGLKDELSTVFAFNLIANGNRFFDGNKAGMVGFPVLLNTRTFVHEMLHQYFPWFTAETISRELNIDIQSHHHVIFTGQSGFGYAAGSRLPRGYPTLCHENFNQIDTVDEKLSITVTEECNPNYVSLVDGLPHNVHSFYELFIMGLTDFSEIDFPFYYGVNFEQSFEDYNESITWTFEELKSIDEETFLHLHEEWYAEKEEQFPGFLNAKEKNMLFMFFGTKPLTNDEYRVLSFISDELTKEDLSIEVPQYAKEGNFKYNRYLSYKKSTLGLGNLTNAFPLPPGYSTTSSEDINASNKLEFYPNPANDRIYFGEVIPDRVQIFNLSGQIVLDLRKSQEVDISSLLSGLYFIRMSRLGEVKTLKLVKK